MINPTGKHIYVKAHKLSESVIVRPDTAEPDESTPFIIIAIGPDVVGLEKGDICVMKRGAVAQLIEGGLVCEADMVCATIT